MGDSFRQLWAENVLSSAGTGFTPVVINNTGVLVLLWLVSLAWWGYFRRSAAPPARLVALAVLTYLLFFLKEAARVFFYIKDFSAEFQIPGPAVFAALILPHGLIEYLALAAAAAFAVGWLSRCAALGRLCRPEAAALLAPLSLVILAAAVESTVTPYLFWLLLTSAG